jgi:integrase/recombinase XerC
MKRSAHPPLSPSGQEALALYEHLLHDQEDLTQSSIRNYLSDLHHFIAWYEIETEAAIYESAIFTPHAITTKTLMHYQSYLQKKQGQKPASVNRTLISLKRYFRWITLHHIIMFDPSLEVKFIGQEKSVPRHLDNQEEQQLLNTVTEAGNLRDRVLIVLLLRAGLRARELCSLRRDQVKMHTENGLLEITGKHNTYREVPLDAIARKALKEFLPTLSPEIAFLFPSDKTSGALSERALGYIVKKYAMIAGLPDVSPHDLRHRFGYRMAKTIPLQQLSQMMGLDSPSTTRLYLLGTKHAKRAAQIMSVDQEAQT